MITKKILLLIALIIIPLTAQSQDFTKKEIKRIKKILKKSNSKIRGFNKNSLISVENIGNSEIEADIETAFFMAGFEVVSNKVAKEAVNISNPLNESNENIEISRSTTYKSVYVITVSGKYFAEPVIGRCQKPLLSFSARIVDLANGGKLVGTFSFSVSTAFSAKCSKDVANAFTYELLRLAEK
jgi:hypothetical protein